MNSRVEVDRYWRALKRQEERERIDRSARNAWRWLKSRPEARRGCSESYMREIREIIKEYVLPTSPKPWKDARMVYAVYCVRHGIGQPAPVRPWWKRVWAAVVGWF